MKSMKVHNMIFCMESVCVEHGIENTKFSHISFPDYANAKPFPLKSLCMHLFITKVHKLLQ